MNYRRVCVKCQCFLSCKKNSVTVVEMASFGPAALWRADMWECPQCGYQTIVGFGVGPIAEHYEKERFEAFLSSAKKENTLYIAYYREGKEEK